MPQEFKKKCLKKKGFLKFKNFAKSNLQKFNSSKLKPTNKFFNKIK